MVVTAPSGHLTAALYNITQYTSSHFQVCRESNIKHLMTGHEGNKVNFFPEGLVLKWFVIAGNFEAGNSLNLAVTTVVGQHSRVLNSALLPS